MIIDLTNWALHSKRGQNRTLPSTGAAATPIIGHGEKNQPVTWPMPSASQASHFMCLAASGAGKTVAIANGLAAEIARSFATKKQDQRLAVLLIDPKGDLIEALLMALCARSPEVLSAVSYLDPFSKGAFPFNLNHLALGDTPLDIRALQLADLVGQVSTAASAQKQLGIGARQVDALQQCLLGALASEHPAANVLWALDALLLPRGFERLAAVTNSERAREFLETTRLSEELKVSSGARLRSAFAATDSLERLIAAPNSIQFHTLLAPGRVCLVDLGRPFGGMAALSSFYASLLCRLAIEYLMERESPWSGHHCRLIIDEAQVVAPALFDRAEAILTTGRSRGLSLGVISQGTTLIHAASETLLKVLLTNTSLKLIGRLSASDAELLAREQAPEKGSERTLPEIRGRFVAAVTNLKDREFFRLLPGSRVRFKTAEVALGQWKRAYEEHAPTIRSLKQALALPPDQARRLTLAEVVGDTRDSSSARRRRGVGAAGVGAATSPAPSRAVEEVPGSPHEAAPRRPGDPLPPRSRWG